MTMCRYFTHPFSTLRVFLFGGLVLLLASWVHAGTYPNCMYWYGTENWTKTWTAESPIGWRLFDSDAGLQSYGVVPTADYQIYAPSGGTVTIGEGIDAAAASIVANKLSLNLTGGSLTLQASDVYPLGGSTDPYPGILRMDSLKLNISGGILNCGAIQGAGGQNATIDFTVSNENYGKLMTTGKARASSVDMDASSSLANANNKRKF